MMKIIYFYAEGYSECKVLSAILNEIEKEQSLITARINCDVNKELIDVYSITIVPTLIFLDNDNNIVKRVAGFISKEVIIEILKYHNPKIN